MNTGEDDMKPLSDEPDLTTTSSGEERRSLDRAIARGVAWTAFGKAANLVVAWSCTVFVARLLQPADYGLVGMSGVFIGFVQLITELGLANIVVYLRTLSRHQIAQLNALALSVGVAAMGLSMAAAPLLAKFYGEPRIVPIVIAASTSFLILGLRTVPYGLMERAMDFRYLAMLEVGQGIVTGPLTLLLAYRGFGYWSLILGQLAGLAVGTAVMVARDPRGFARPRLSALGDAARLSYHLVVARVAWYTYSNSDQVIVGRRLGAGSLGAYSLAFSVASAPVDKITALLVRVTRPAFAAVQDRPSEIKRMFLHVSAALAFVTVPASVGLAVLSSDLITAVFGDKWVDAVMPVALLSLCTPIRSLAPLLPQILTAVGDSGFAMRLNLLAAIVMPLSFIIGSTFGASGVAAAWVVVYPALVIPSAWRVSHRINLTLREYLSVTGPSVLGAVLMGIGVLAVRAALPSTWPPLVRIMLLVPLGVAIFFTVMFTAFRSRTKEYLAALKRLRGR